MTAPIPRDLPDLPAVPSRPRLLPSPVPATAVVPPARRPLAAAFRLLTALLALTGVTIQLLLGDPAARPLSHFTVQSGVLLALVLLASARRAWSAGRPLTGALTGAALLYAAVAGLVHHLLLANTASPFAAPDGTGTGTGWHAVASHILHTAVPLAATLDWLLLTTPGRLHLRQATAWLLYPLAYLAYSLARGELLLPGSEDRYLYPFLDVDEHGYKGVLGNALLVGLAVYALAVLVVALDHIRPNPLRRRW
ncbi:Pr6Pr family membrane protein [Streptomyces lancefieldiae]|uniref:Pr6Pr family membrane protein n=1 Tax=Streptomyces lancefieldiae TaxID=3075520 RepID=A0ABU3B5H6_9ACTN|nr:Pr6Pr family membrane protein [Streptomyces sp. DSM 40712]MDT0616261.1 Pr6Pr family membrane protein [Streptomyces sp. DSM 40712]